MHEELKAKDATPVVVTPTIVENRSIPSQGMTDEIVMAQYEEATKAGFPTSKMLGVMSLFADNCVKTMQMPKTIETVEKAIMVFQAGRELGIPPMKSLYSFYFVNNKLTMYGPTVIERIRNWAKIEYGICDDKEANITITRKDDGTSLATKVTMADLQKRGLAGKDTFTKHPKTMLLYKAVGEIVRHIVPEAVGGCAVEGDWGADSHADMSTPTYRDTTATLAIDIESERSKITVCKTLEELKLAWANLKPEAKQMLEETRDEMKAILDTEAKETIA